MRIIILSLAVLIGFAVGSITTRQAPETSCKYEGAECPHVLLHRSELYGHICKWENCPYLGIPPGLFEQAVKKYSGCEEGSDCYYIDVLHLEFPAEDYDQLQTRLFTAN